VAYDSVHVPRDDGLVVLIARWFFSSQKEALFEAFWLQSVK
jgi:hypothetical protein